MRDTETRPRAAPLLTVETADELGWTADERTDGAWGRPATRRCWRVQKRSWGVGVWHARCFDAEADALWFVEGEIAGLLGITRVELREHLNRVLAARKAAP